MSLNRITPESLLRMSWHQRAKREAKRRHEVRLAAIDHHRRYHWHWVNGRYCVCPYAERRLNA